MKLRIASDLHLEIYSKKEKALKRLLPPGPDQTLVLAGDILTLQYHKFLFDYFSKNFKNVVYVPGNHDFWKGSITDGLRVMNIIDDTYDNVYPLYNKTVTIDDQMFAGTTMWYEPNPYADESVNRDFESIYDFDVHKMKIENLEAHRFLHQCATDSIVVTHHAPLVNSINKVSFGAEHMYKFYSYHAQSIITMKHPKLWIHGHTHLVSRYFVYDTEIISNPYGMGQFIEPMYNKEFIIER